MTKTEALYFTLFALIAGPVFMAAGAAAGLTAFYLVTVLF